MKKLIYLFGLILISSVCISQDTLKNNADSLLNLIRTSRESATNVERFNDLVSKHFAGGMQNNKDSLELFMQMTIEQARRLNDTEGLAYATYNLGKFYVAASGSYAIATPYLLESLTLFQGLNDSSGISKSYMQLGLISYMLQYFEDAIKKFQLSVEYSENSTSMYLLAISYSELNDFDESMKYFSIAIQDFKEQESLSQLDECYMYLGKLYEKEGVLDSAFYYLNIAIENREKKENPEIMARAYALISGTYLKTNNLKKAIQYAQSGYEAAQIGDDEVSGILATETLSKAYERLGDYKQAHYFLKLYHTLKNENIQGNTKQKIAEMQSTFDFTKKINDQKIKYQLELHRKNRIKNIMLASGILVLLIAGALWSRLQFVRKSRAAIQKEKDISENLLLNILPENVANELKEKGYTDAREFEKATILFSDFKGFTALSQQMTASDLVDEIDTCFKAFDDIMDKYGLEKIKTIGDAYMAAGGLQVPETTQPGDVVKAGLEMQDFIIQRREKHLELGIPSFEMRIGIHTGPVIAGVVGIKKFQYDIWGDTVNTASRMESSGAVGQVNISQATYELLTDTERPALSMSKGSLSADFTFESRGKIEAKGKGEIEMWFVTLNNKQQ